MMGRNFACDFDEAELMDELNELDEELISDQLNEGAMPSYIPAKPNEAGGNAEAAKQPAAP